MRLSSGSPREKRSFIFFGRCAKVAVYKRLFWTTALLDGKGENLPFWRTLWRTVGWEVRTSPTPYYTRARQSDTHRWTRSLPGRRRSEFGTRYRTPGEPGVVLTRCFEHENQEIFSFFFFNIKTLDTYRCVKEPKAIETIWFSAVVKQEVVVMWFAKK